MKYLDNLSVLGTPTAGKQVSRSDPLPRMKSTLIEKAKFQVDMIRGGIHVDRCCWFKRNHGEGGNATYVAWLRNGTKLLPLTADANYLEVKGVDQLLEFFERVITACESGEFDEILMETAPKKRKNHVG